MVFPTDLVYCLRILNNSHTITHYTKNTVTTDTTLTTCDDVYYER